RRNQGREQQDPRLVPRGGGRRRAVRRERGPRPRRPARRSRPILDRQDLGRAARRASGGTRRRIAERQRCRAAHDDPHATRLAVERRARFPAPDQEPLRPRRTGDSVPAAPRPCARRGRTRPRSHRPRRRRGRGRMTLRLHNTLTRRVEPFVPLQPGRVSLYTCGPTIYNYAHIGNFRTFLFEDLLRRWLEASGYDVLHIMNLTDVDDRTIAAAREKGVSLRAHVDPFARAFEEDRDWLRIKPPTEQPRATEYIGPMITLIQGLLDRGVAYLG